MESAEIIRNARQAWKDGEITLDEMNDIVRRAFMDAELAEA